MTIDINPFKEFLSSLSRISQLNFQLWDGKGLVFASGTDTTKNPNLRANRDFSAEVMRQAANQCSQCEGGYLMLGAPIKYGQEVIGSLIAYGPSSDREWQSVDTLSGKTSYAKETETFLSQLAGVMEYTWASRREAEEMAEELAQSFEDLSLYGRIASQIKRLKFSGALLKTLLEELLETIRSDLAFVEMPNRQEYNALVSKKEISDKIPEQKPFVINLIKSIPVDFS